MGVMITNEMWEAAVRESRKRESNIVHHFNVDHMSAEQRNVIGFLGEFACREYMGLDWRKGIRENYDDIDQGDILLPGLTIDIKTETVPEDFLKKLLNGQVSDDRPYGRRLINQGQVPLLHKYDYVVWGAFPRDSYGTWYPLGYLEVDYILKHYSVTSAKPFGGTYPTPCLNVRHSELKNINGLIRMAINQ